MWNSIIKRISHIVSFFTFFMGGDSDEGNKGIKLSKINDQNLVIKTGWRGSGMFLLWLIYVYWQKVAYSILSLSFHLSLHVIYSLDLQHLYYLQHFIYIYRLFSQFHKHMLCALIIQIVAGFTYYHSYICMAK